MKPSITLGLLCMLFSEVAALTCYECLVSSQTCTNTAVCSRGTCASVTTIAYAFGSKLEEQNARACITADQCMSGSVNFGSARSTVSTQCCSTDKCNSAKAPELNSFVPNGKKCFTCEGNDCTKELSCLGTEDRCIKATSEVSGQKVTLKGCASKNTCVDLPAQLRSVTVGVSCCEGNLCNSAKGVGQSILLLLGSLISVLLFH